MADAPDFATCKLWSDKDGNIISSEMFYDLNVTDDEIDAARPWAPAEKLNCAACGEPIGGHDWVAQVGQEHRHWRCATNPAPPAATSSA